MNQAYYDRFNDPMNYIAPRQFPADLDWHAWLEEVEHLWGQRVVQQDHIDRLYDSWIAGTAPPEAVQRHLCGLPTERRALLVSIGWAALQLVLVLGSASVAVLAIAAFSDALKFL